MTGKSCLVAIPAFGADALTHAVLPDIFAESDVVDVVVIDNGGQYQPLADERVVRPGCNLGWAAASNLAFRMAFSGPYRFAVTLNNDTRLSPGFFAGLLDDRIPADAAIIGAMYDDTAWASQNSPYRGHASGYQPLDYYRKVATVDGTALMYSRQAWLRIGELDSRSFGRFAWGADIDLAIRARAAGFGLYVTERSFLNHGRQVAARSAFTRYPARARRDERRGMRRIHTARTKADIVAAPVIRIPFDATSRAQAITPSR